MDGRTLTQLPPEMALGVVNEQLRIACKDLHELAVQMDVSEAEITRRLDTLGYHYEEAVNQFKPH